MRVPVALSEAFGEDFQSLMTQFVVEEGLLPDAESLVSPRFLARSVVPHIQRLSDLFNRVERLHLTDEELLAEMEAPPGTRRKPRTKTPTEATGLDPYWTRGSNPQNLRLAYFLYFMPSNLFRVASVWAELARLGYRWPEGRALDAIELGSGPASGACGIAAGEAHAPLGLAPQGGRFALLEQDKPMLELGARWAAQYFSQKGRPETAFRTFRRKLDFTGPLLPAGAPRFNLWLSSFFLNESRLEAPALAQRLLETWKKHLDEEGIVILVEPALKVQSRKLLELRREILKAVEDGSAGFPLQVLLPCLGHQACGALADPEDWCHEEVSWWRPPYFQRIDQMAGLDRRSLPFSYLVLARSSRPRHEILPALANAAGTAPAKAHRLVSPSHSEGQDLEFFVCGHEGKRRARYRPLTPKGDESRPTRGTVLIEAQIRGDARASKIDRVERIL